MEVKQYQQRVVNEVEDYLRALSDEEKTSLLLSQAAKSAGRRFNHDVPSKAWEQLISRPYLPWKNGLNESIPSVCLKVPTGGGKTYLATRCIELINLIYLQKKTGLVLWIVPSRQIYRDTLKALRNRAHFYRQGLDRASGGRTLILEKTDVFTPAQIEANLVVLMLMLPSANRADKETLKMFQDSAGFQEFFPPEDRIPLHMEVLEQYPNLEYFGNPKHLTGVVIKTSLGNTLRILKPIVILDEGHKAYSTLARDTLKSFNPCFVLELSATPQPASNILVEVTGQELHQEEMIKLDLNILSKASPRWEDTLLAGFHRIETLSDVAHSYRSNGGRYIRPICLIQVERTGAKQDIGEYIHANDARKFLIEQCSVSPQQIAIKSAEDDGLEDIDLLSPDCPIQYIITKSALQEGWDCSFAYVLVVLSAATSQTGLTQLVGRILRQPDGKKTGIKDLDESYVYCFQRQTGDVLRAIQTGFVKEGLSDLRHLARETKESDIKEVDVGYRPQFKSFAGKIYLPQFMVQEADRFRPLSYEMDILRYIDWDSLNAPEIINLTLSTLPAEDVKTSVGIDDADYAGVAGRSIQTNQVTIPIDPLFMIKQLSESIPNAWVAARLVKEAIQFYREKYSDDRISANMFEIINQLRWGISAKISGKYGLAENVFRSRLQKKEIAFFLKETTAYDYVLPSTIKIGINQPRLSGVQRTLFDTVPANDLNNTETAVAIYLDRQSRLLWWYRNLVGAQGYKIQGWQPNAIYADLIVGEADTVDGSDYTRVHVIETKGLHLKGNADTEYKGSIFELCNQLGKEVEWESLRDNFGENAYGRKEVVFQMIYEDQWQSTLSQLFESDDI